MIAGGCKENSSTGAYACARRRWSHDSLVDAMKASRTGGGGNQVAILVGVTELRLESRHASSDAVFDALIVVGNIEEASVGDEVVATADDKGVDTVSPLLEGLQST
jgi:hypothetical protein